jgi:hypothetical protein
LDKQLVDGEFDLSSLSYPQFVAFIFERPVVASVKEEFDLFLLGIENIFASSPSTVLAHLQAMCRDFSELTKAYSEDQLDQGLWALFGGAISCEDNLFDPTVDLRLRIDCIESMYLPFSDYVARSAMGKRDSFYWMWWDMILHTFWQMADGYNCDYAALSADGRQMLEAIYQTLLKILALEHQGCQWSALHGLGHLHHPLCGETVQKYLDTHRNELTVEDVRWIEACRDGAIA